jgi:serine/threonine-protein kinase RsbT
MKRFSLKMKGKLETECLNNEKPEKIKNELMNMERGYVYHEDAINRGGNLIDYFLFDIYSTPDKTTGLRTEQVIIKKAVDIFSEISKQNEKWLLTSDRISTAKQTTNFENHSKLFKKHFTFAQLFSKNNHSASFNNIEEIDDEEEPWTNALKNEVLAIKVKSDIINARVKAQALAEAVGFGYRPQTEIATAVSELARNTLEYAGGGQITVSIAKSHRKKGLQIVAEAEEPDIANLEEAFEKDKNSKKGLGVGLGTVKRLVDEFTIEKEIGKGNKIIVKKWKTPKNSFED